MCDCGVVYLWARNGVHQNDAGGRTQPHGVHYLSDGLCIPCIWNPFVLLPLLDMFVEVAQVIYNFSARCRTRMVSAVTDGLLFAHVFDA